MMKLIGLFLLLASRESWGFNKDFTLVNDKAPLEFKLMFESMKNSLKDNQEQVRLIVLAQQINKGLGPLKKDQSFVLLKSEVYKTLLEWPHPPTQFQVGSHTLQRINTHLATGRAVYNPFSIWVLEALAADLDKFEKEGLLAMTQAQRANLTGDKAQQHYKMQRVLKFTRGWIEQADTLSAKDFNALTDKLAWRTLERVKETAMLFRRHSSKAIADTQSNTFNIPEQGMPKKSPGAGETKPDPGPKGMAEQAADEKKAAEATMQKINTDGATLPAEELSGAIDRLQDDVPPSGGTAPSPVPPIKSVPGDNERIRPTPAVDVSSEPLQ
jgi:hypothetical protein